MFALTTGFFFAAPLWFSHKWILYVYTSSGVFGEPLQKNETKQTRVSSPPTTARFFFIIITFFSPCSHSRARIIIILLYVPKRIHTRIMCIQYANKQTKRHTHTHTCRIIYYIVTLENGRRARVYKNNNNNPVNNTLVEPVTGTHTVYRGGCKPPRPPPVGEGKERRYRCPAEVFLNFAVVIPSGETDEGVRETVAADLYTYK